jgi:nicotinate phosphoribosyltransferase
MVQAFMAMGEGELGAFRAYAEVYPDDCLLLVDTIDTLASGIPNAIKVFSELRRKGHAPLGIRLDSGDLAYLSLQAAKMLDTAGFPDTRIVLSNQLDEITLTQIIRQIEEEAPACGLDADHVIKRLVFGVGTHLITSRGDAALDGVYKLVGLERDGSWVPAIKISETPAKTLNPGDKEVWRLYDRRGKATADLLALRQENPRRADPLVLRHPTEHGTLRTLTRASISQMEPMLEEVVRAGQRTGAAVDIAHMRLLRQDDMERMDAGVKRLVNPHMYHVSLTQGLWDLKQSLIEAARLK